ncbi:unnamed protein product [Jaminaea pallidilutea]
MIWSSKEKQEQPSTPRNAGSNGLHMHSPQSAATTTSGVDSPNGSTANSVTRRSQEPPTLLPIFITAGGLYVAWAWRTRNTSRIAALRSAADRSAGEASAWREAYFRTRARGGRHDALEAVVKGEEPPEPQVPVRSRTTAGGGGFVSPVYARQAEREQRLADEKQSSWILDRAGGIKSDHAMQDEGSGASQRGFEASTQSPDNKTSRDGAQRTEAQPVHHVWRAGPSGWHLIPRHSAPSRSSNEVNSAKAKWQRAFGGGVNAHSADETSAWERYAQDKQKQAMHDKTSSEEVQAQSQDSGTGKKEQQLDRLRKRDQRLQAKHRRVEGAILDELDAVLLSQHSGKEREPAEDADKSCADRKAAEDSDKQDAGQHYSMDNLFLDAQLDAAAREGREARNDRRSRDLRAGIYTDASHSAASTGPYQQDNRSDNAQARAAMSAPFGSEQDIIVEELAQEILGRSAADSGETPSSSEEAETAQDGFVEACMRHAEEEGRQLRRDHLVRRERNGRVWDATRPDEVEQGSRFTIVEPEELEAQAVEAAQEANADPSLESRETMDAETAVFAASDAAEASQDAPSPDAKDSSESANADSANTTNKTKLEERLVEELSKISRDHADKTERLQARISQLEQQLKASKPGGSGRKRADPAQEHEAAARLKEELFEAKKAEQAWSEYVRRRIGHHAAAARCFKLGFGEWNRPFSR